MQWVQALFSEFPEGKTLQRSDPSREQLLAFFEKGREMFEGPQFKMHLVQAHHRRMPTDDVIDGMQRTIWEQLGIQGDFGMNYLAKVRKAYSQDAEVLKIFYEFVHLEEKAMDEAELPDDIFRKKYETLNAMREEMEKQMDEIQKLSPEEQQAQLAAIYKKMVMQGQGGSCCEAPGAQDACCSAPPMEPMRNGRNLSEDEQLAFFQQMQNGMQR